MSCPGSPGSTCAGRDFTLTNNGSNYSPSREVMGYWLDLVRDAARVSKRYLKGVPGVRDIKV